MRQVHISRSGQTFNMFASCNVQEALTNTWDLERGRVGKVQALKEKLDALKVEIEHAERGYDLNKAAELKYAVMPKLQVRFARTRAGFWLRVCETLVVDSLLFPFEHVFGLSETHLNANAATLCRCRHDR